MSHGRANLTRAISQMIVANSMIFYECIYKRYCWSRDLNLSVFAFTILCGTREKWERYSTAVVATVHIATVRIATVATLVSFSLPVPN